MSSRDVPRFTMKQSQMVGEHVTKIESLKLDKLREQIDLYFAYVKKEMTSPNLPWLQEPSHVELFAYSMLLKGISLAIIERVGMHIGHYFPREVIGTLMPMMTSNFCRSITRHIHFGAPLMIHLKTRVSYDPSEQELHASIKQFIEILKQYTLDVSDIDHGNVNEDEAKHLLQDLLQQKSKGPFNEPNVPS